MKLTKHPVQRVLLFIFLGFALILSSCASVPKASIELANTVGRDLEEVHRAHRALASLLFDIMEKDINKFIDEI
ncbi:MAG: hypothetical protein HUN05_19035 [Desulfobacter sp.]|nr:MAG: hypothetical protein HUN05_19035 [Desulfobacter sp.]